MTAPNIEYLAGFFDGEGTVSVRIDDRELKCGVKRASIGARVQTAKAEEPEMFYNRFGGKLYTTDRSQYDQPGDRTIYVWEALTSEAADVLKELLPHLRGKREEAELAIRLNELVGKPGQEVPKENAERRLELAHEIRSLR